MKAQFKSYVQTKCLVLIAGDILVIMLSFAFVVSIESVISDPIELNQLIDRSLFVCVSTVIFFPLIFYFLDLYNEVVWRANARLFSFLIIAVIAATTIIILVNHTIFPGVSVGRSFFFIFTILSFIFTFFWRKAFIKIFDIINVEHKKILLLGNGPIMDEIKAFHSGQDLILIDTLSVEVEHSCNTMHFTLNETKTTNNFLEILQRGFYDTIIVSGRLVSFAPINEFLMESKFMGAKIYDAPYYLEELMYMVPVNHVRESWFLFRNQGNRFNPQLYRKASLIIDTIIAFIGLIVISPILLAAAIAIKFTSKGPVFFIQERLGLNNKLFKIIKLRTMIDNAEEKTGQTWAAKNDPRITWLGRILRKCRLDEFPQLINVLKGDMRLVGPRPIRKYAADLLSKKIPYYQLRFMVKPGLTGWAQVKGGYGTTIDEQAEKLAYDLYYIQNCSLFFDLLIILKTLKTIVFLKGD
jgi:exopolysaccharide biosynthesis polyprenyl glycosylphosphotransferase